MEQLEGKVAFVTGGASGIGLGITKAMVAAGMRVVMADVREDHLEAARAWFLSQQQSRRVKAVKLDVTNRGVINGILTILPRMRAHGEGGHIVNTSSMAALVPIPNCAIYITAK